jgi:hypothetical protein
MSCRRCAWDRCADCSKEKAAVAVIERKLEVEATRCAKAAAKVAAEDERAAAKVARELRSQMRAAAKEASLAKRKDIESRRAALKAAKAAAVTQRRAIKTAKLAFARKRAADKQAKIKMANAIQRAQEEKKAAAQAAKSMRRASIGEKPKRPAGGAWGVFLGEKRDEIRATLPTDHKITDVTRAASERYKSLTDEERRQYEEIYKERLHTYQAELIEYRRAAVKNGFHPTEPPTPSRKRRRIIDDAPSPVKERRAPVKVPSEYLQPIEAEALEEAAGLGYETALRALACRRDIVQKKLPAAKLVRALRAAGGSAKKAASALLRG